MNSKIINNLTQQEAVLQERMAFNRYKKYKFLGILYLKEITPTLPFQEIQVRPFVFVWSGMLAFHVPAMAGFIWG